jgi:fructose-1,6-bisphosphatase/inositol monophosphatase family enzyme
MRIPHDDVEALMAEASETLVMPRFGRLRAGEIDEKRANDFVTVADREAEAFLAPRLAALLPGARVLGEEEAAGDPARLARLDGETPLWLIDPVDGTRAFIDGTDDFALIVALVRGAELLGGWILQPRLARRLATERGGGVIRTGFATAPLAADPAAPPRGMLLGRLPDGTRARDRAAAQVAILPRPGGGAIAFLELAAGHVDIAYFGRGWPWDHAAGALAAIEGGGAARFLVDGAAYTPRRWNTPLLVTRAADRWSTAQGMLLGRAAP